MATMTLDVKGTAMRRAVRNLVDHCRAERDYFERNGKGSTAEAFEKLRDAFETALTIGDDGADVSQST